MRKIVILGKKGIPRIFGKKIVSSKVHNHFNETKSILPLKECSVRIKNNYLDFEISY